MPVGIASPSLYLDRFSGLLRRTAGEPDWLRRRRETAMEHFLALGVPTPRDEEYKYTDLSPLASGEALFAAGSAETNGGPPSYARTPNEAIRFGGGSDISGFERPGVRVLSLREALREEPGLLERDLAQLAPRPEEHALSALNTAFFEEAAVVLVDPGAIVSDPVQVVFADGEGARNARVLIHAGRNSSVQVVETYFGSGAYWRNAVTEIYAAKNARVVHCRAQLESADAVHTGLLQGVQDRDSYVASFSLSFGARVTRNDIGTRLKGTGCECSLDGLYAVRGNQHVDHHTAIDHAMPHCHSHQLYKGVLDDRAKGVFNGKIFVRRDAQKTDAVQSNKNLLLSDFSEVNTKPQLEIDANDVRCTHGATIGQLDASAAFYLRSRGISASQARSMLTYAFAADALERVRIEPVKEHFEGLLLERFAGSPR